MRKKSYRDSERQHRRSGKAQGGHARRPRPKNNRGKNHAPRSSKNETSLAESDRGSDQARRTRHDSTSNSSSSQSPERTRPREKRRPKKEPSSESNSDSFESERTSDSERPKRQQYTVVKQSETEENEEYDRKLREWRLREKMSAYEARLKVWVSRERFMAKERKRKRRIEQLKQIEAAKTTRLLNAFMEHYNDRRDDAKYYSGGAVWIRVRFREREIAFDIKDRARERKELEKARLKRAAKNTSCGVAEKKCTGFIELPGELERQDPVKPLSDSSRQVTSMLEENDCIEIPLPTATLQPDQSRAKDCVDSAELPGKLDRQDYISVSSDTSGHAEPMIGASDCTDNPLPTAMLKPGQSRVHYCMDSIEPPGEKERQASICVLSDSCKHVASSAEAPDGIEIPLPTATLQPDQSGAKDFMDSTEVPGKIDRQDYISFLNDSNSPVESMFGAYDCTDIVLPPVTLERGQNGNKDCTQSIELPGELEREASRSVSNDSVRHAASWFEAAYYPGISSPPITIQPAQSGVKDGVTMTIAPSYNSRPAVWTDRFIHSVSPHVPAKERNSSVGVNVVAFLPQACSQFVPTTGVWPYKSSRHWYMRSSRFGHQGAWPGSTSYR